MWGGGSDMPHCWPPWASGDVGCPVQLLSWTDSPAGMDARQVTVATTHSTEPMTS